VSETAHSGWEQYFGFTEPYSNQDDAIERIIETATEAGYVAMEGPCGTGKTMASLAAGGYLLRETSQFDTVVVATPVKQQRQQFVEDLRRINGQLEEPLSGVSLVGKRDLCPYGREDVFPEGERVQSRCEELRETTAELVGEESDLVADSGYAGPAGDADPISDDDQWWDPAKARTLVDHARRPTGTDGLSSGGRTSPYPRAQPATTPEMGGDTDQRLYCPFEADWYARNKGSPVTFAAGEEHVVTPAEFLPEAVDAGLCPHRAMMVLLENADVVIGNYNHLFDAASRQLTAPILDERTLVIVDEAHRLEERVRDLLTDRIGYYSIKQAKRDLGVLLERARQLSDGGEAIDGYLAQHEVSWDEIEAARTFYGDALSWLESRVDAELRERVDSYGTGLSQAVPEADFEIQLRDPETNERDAFSVWAAENGYDDAFFRTLSTVGLAVEDALEGIGHDRECVCTAIGALFGQWRERDHTEYFREIELDHSPKDRRNVESPWLRHYNASLVMYNCMPSTKIKRILEELGGGVLMSATLEPLSIFSEVSGLDELATGEPDAATDSRRSRSVATRTYDLTFPERNRASWIVDVAPFTKRNRGDPRVTNRNATRQRYAYVARLIAESHGNVMLCWPNYREAAWAAARLEESIEKPVLLDRSSSHERTRELKRRFAAGEPKVLVTSTRGTLTEGVDYEGDDLHTCAVFGIPLVNIGSPRVKAVKHAYGSRFGDANAFTYALTIPAVRQVRQALGRVIRGPDERGVRIVVGRRFVPDAVHSVYEYLPANEREEFVRMKPDFLTSQFEAFWNG
jgi:DNA excision repair protein ERCC-2